jgi:hypothetical protein
MEIHSATDQPTPLHFPHQLSRQSNFVDKKDMNFNEDAERFRIKSQLDLAIGTDPHKFTSNIEAFLTKARLTPKNLGVIARLDKAVKTIKRKNKYLDDVTDWRVKSMLIIRLQIDDLWTATTGTQKLRMLVQRGIDTLEENQTILNMIQEFLDTDDDNSYEMKQVRNKFVDISENKC